jgi:hypothetical protein
MRQTGETPCLAADLNISVYEQAGGIDGMVTIEISVSTSRECGVREITATLIAADGTPVPGVPVPRALLDRTLQPGSPQLLATVIWHNWCDQPATGPFGAVVDVNGKSLVVPRLALTPLCFAGDLGPVLVIELAPPGIHQPVRPGLITYGNRLAALTSASDGSAVADLFEVREFTCPGDPGYVFAVCEGRPDGTVVNGFAIGRWSSEGNVVPRASFVAAFQDMAGAFLNNDLRLFTISETGFGDCPECAILVLSTPADAAASDGTVQILVFQVRPSGSQYRIVSIIDGFVSRAGELAVVNGGIYSGKTFIRIEPGGPQPPEVGTGIQGRNDGLPLTGAALMFAGLLLVGASGVALRRSTTVSTGQA